MSDKEQIEKETPAEKEVETKEETKEIEAKKEKVAKKKEVESGKTPPKAVKEQNIIYIGTKPPMSYVMAIITAFNASGTDRVVLKARGRAISTAVDVAEITRNRFFKDAKVHSIAIGTEEVPSREGGNARNVSIMEITIKK